MVNKPAQLVYLAGFSAIIVYSYSVLLGSDFGANERSNSSDEWYKVSPEMLYVARRLNVEDRLLETIKETWPECVTNKLTSVECKDFIDEEILTLFTGEDRFIQTHIISKRATADEWYNCVAISMDDNNLVLGRNGDGLVYYDFEWYGSGEEATPEQQQEIPPITAIETPSGAVDGSVIETAYVQPATVPVVVTVPFNFDEPIIDEVVPPLESTFEEETTSTQATTSTVITTPFVPIVTIAPYQFEGDLFVEAPLEVLDEPALVVGGVTDDVIAGIDTNPINGGVILDPASESTPEGITYLEEILNEPTAIEPAGPRVLPPFDCAGLTGFDCCLLIKKTVSDSDVNGKSIQCFLDYEESTCKKEWWREILEAKRVMIYENDLGLVNTDPIIEGAWPSCDEKWGNTTVRDWNPPPTPLPTSFPTPSLQSPTIAGPTPPSGPDSAPSLGGPTSPSTGGDSPTIAGPTLPSPSTAGPTATPNGCEVHLQGPALAALPQETSGVCPAMWLPNFAYQGGDKVQAKGLVFRCKGLTGTSCNGGQPACEPCNKTSSVISWESKWQVVGKCDNKYYCPAPNGKPGFIDQYNTHLYSVITKGDMVTAAKIHHSRIYVGGKLTNPGTTSVQCKGGSYFASLTGKFVFTGGHKELRDTPPPLDFGYYEKLARYLSPGTYTGGFEVIVKTAPKMPSGACYTTSEFLGQGYDVAKNRKTLIVFNFVGDICVTKTSTESKFGPSILAPFSQVTIQGTGAGGVEGIVIAKSLVVTNNLHEFSGHAYNGPLFCSTRSFDANGFDQFGKYVGFAQIKMSSKSNKSSGATTKSSRR